MSFDLCCVVPWPRLNELWNTGRIVVVFFHYLRFSCLCFLQSSFSKYRCLAFSSYLALAFSIKNRLYSRHLLQPFLPSSKSPIGLSFPPLSSPFHVNHTICCQHSILSILEQFTLKKFLNKKHKQPKQNKHPQQNPSKSPNTRLWWR